jgi:hypothetical protein
VVAVEGLERRIVGTLVENIALGRVVHPWEERYPDHLLEGLWALGRDQDAIAMRAFGRLDLALWHALEQALPEIGREDRRVVPVAVCGGALMLRQQLQKEGAAGSGEAADVDRPLDPHVGDLIRKQPRL